MPRKRKSVKIYKTRPKGWSATDPARSSKQAKAFVRSGYGDSEARAVKTGKRGDIFPYTIYTRPKRKKR